MHKMQICHLPGSANELFLFQNPHIDVCQT